MKTKYCKKCCKTKPVDRFADNNRYCNWCMHLSRRYKASRLEFSKTILSDEEIKNEMRTIKKISSKGLNALGDLTQEFDSLIKIKSFPKSSNGASGFRNGAKASFQTKNYF